MGRSGGARQSIVSKLCEAIDPPLFTLTRQHPQLLDWLEQANIQLPLKQYLSTYDCAPVANNFCTAAHILDESIEDDLNNIHIISAGESLRLIADVLYSINSQLPQEEICWCGVCFRRAQNHSDYCSFHNPSTEDTNYRTGLRLRKQLGESEITQWNLYRASRSLLGENTLIFSGEENIPDRISSQETGIRVSSEYRKMIEITRSKSWNEAAQFWEQILVHTPHVQELLAGHTETCKNWEEYAALIHKKLDDPVENTNNPLWVLRIIAMAERWFCAKSRLSDRRRSGTEDAILSLFEAGMTRGSDIGRFQV